MLRGGGLTTASFEEVWGRIVTHTGEIFHTKTGLEFTYRVEGNGVYPSRTDYRIPKTDFEKAYQRVPCRPADINKIVRGPAYVWAILHDKRNLSKGQ